MSADTFAIIASSFAVVLMLLCVYLTYKLIVVYDENARLRDLHDADTAQFGAMKKDCADLVVKAAAAQDAATKALDQLALTTREQTQRHTQEGA
jgi:hypothetical protein